MSSVFPTPNSLNFSAPVYTVQDLINEIRINTKIPNPQQLSDQKILYYLNQTVTMDASQYIQSLAYKTLMTIVLQPNVDKYTFNFNQYIILASAACQVNGYNIQITQDWNYFNTAWQNQQQNQIVSVANGVDTTYTFFVSAPVLRGQFDPFGNYLPGLSIVGITSSGIQYDLWDNGEGQFASQGSSSTLGSGTVNYLTGECTVTFDTPPFGPIQANVTTYSSGQPGIVLFYSNTLQFRNVPDKSYVFSCEAYVNPISYAESTQPVILNNSFLFFVYATCKRILREYKDLSQLAIMNQMFDEQKRMFDRGSQRQRNQSPIPCVFNAYTPLIPWQSNVPYGII